MPNATHGVNTVLRSIDFRVGDEILITDHAYGACRNAAAFAAERSGATLRVARLPSPVTDAFEVVDAIAAAASTKTRLALIDHVTSSTALVLPIGDIVAALNGLGIITLVDGAHGPGMIPIDIADIDADVYVANAHKWMCAPKGAAFLVAADRIRDALVPLAVGFGYSAETEGRSRFHSMFDWVGTDDPTATLSIPRALDVVGNAIDGGWSGVMSHNHELALTGRKLIHEAIGTEPCIPAEMIGSMAAVSLPDSAQTHFYNDPLQRHLRERHSIVVPVTQGPGPQQRWLRVSAQLYNDRNDFERLAAALADWKR